MQNPARPSTVTVAAVAIAVKVTAPIGGRDLEHKFGAASSSGAVAIATTGAVAFLLVAVDGAVRQLTLGGWPGGGGVRTAVRTGRGAAGYE